MSSPFSTRFAIITQVRPMDKKQELFALGDVLVYERGTRLIKKDHVSGDVAYISSTKFNNGISAFIDPPDFMSVYERKMTLSNSGSVGYLFYHPYRFVASDHVTVLDIKDPQVKLTSELALYLKPVLESARSKFGFGREANNDRLKDLKLLLPVDQHGEPDWRWMGQRIAKLRKTVTFSRIPAKRSGASSSLDHVPWAEYSIGSLFELKKGKRLTKAEMYPGNTLFLGASSKDNGVTALIDEAALHPGNVLTVNYNGSVAEAHYQLNPFFASDDVNVLYPKHSGFSIYQGLFVATVIKLYRAQYFYGRKWTLDAMRKSRIKLPQSKDGNPDFMAMERYMKSLPYAYLLESRVSMRE